MTLRTVSIVGAGPAGLTAAITLARAGYDVVVHERHADVGMRFSEDFQALENWTTEKDTLAMVQRFGIPADFYWRPIDKVSSCGPRSSAQVSFTEPPALAGTDACEVLAMAPTVAQRSLGRQQCLVHVAYSSAIGVLSALRPRRGRASFRFRPWLEGMRAEAWPWR
ncbi:MAG: FAD-dependent oxidoreductase [Nitrospiraceae bacterium]